MIANKMLFLFLLISSTFARSPGLVVCDGIIFHDVYFDREQLFNDRGRPYNLVIHKYSGVLFFSHTIQNGTLVDFGITGCHIERKECDDIDGVPGGYAIAYDQGNDDIYFGGHNGLYKFNFITKSADFFSEKGKSIWDIFIRKHFYYIEYPNQKLYVYQDDMFVKVAEAQNIEIDHFYIAKNEDIYYSNKTALYKIERLYRTVVSLNDQIAVRQIAEDAYGDVYFLASDGIYLEDKPFHYLKKVANIEQAFGMTFDGNDNVIYSDKTSVYRLTPSKNMDICYHALTKPKEDEFDFDTRIIPKDIFV